METGSGCTRSTNAPLKQEPAKAVELRLTQGSRSYVLGRADAQGSDFAVHWDAATPAGVRPGPARLTADSVDVAVVIS